MEYNTEDQPWDPMSAVTSSLLGDIGTITMAVADFPREIFEKRISKTNTVGNSAPGEGQAEGASLASSASASASAPSLLLPQNQSDPALAPAIPPRSRAGTTSSGLGSSQKSSLVGATSPGRNLSPSPSIPSQRPASRGDASPSSPNPLNIETAMDAGEGVGRIVTTGMKMPMNVCMGLARGFRNAPRLYNDDTVRPTEKVTSLGSGLRVAGKEFGLGLYDGISGLVTQPLKGAEKEGGRGLLKGVGKGIGGLFLKPAAAIWSLPAYTMQGVHAEVRNLFAKSSVNYIITSRVVQGQEDLATATMEEQKDILARWQQVGDDLKGFHLLKQKEKSGSLIQEGGHDGSSFTALSSEARIAPPKTGWLHTRSLSFDERKRLHKEKDVWKRQQDVQRTSSGGLSSSTEDEEFERAIRASVKQTSHGDKDEDARVEAAIRASLSEMRRIAEEQGREEKGDIPLETPTSAVHAMPQDADLRDITDEEYQALIEEAVRQSLAGKQHQQASLSPHNELGVGADADLQRAMETSRAAAAAGNAGHLGGDDQELRLAMEESKRAHQLEMEKQKTEEDIVLEYVKKQSLAEEEYRRSKVKGKAVASGGSGQDEDEDLRRAVEESLRMGGRGYHPGSGEGSGRF